MDNMPVFVKIKEPSELKGLIDSLRQDIGQTREVLSRIDDLSNSESAKFSEWKSNFNAINDKIELMKELLTEPERL